MWFIKKEHSRIYIGSWQNQTPFRLTGNLIKGIYQRELLHYKLNNFISNLVFLLIFVFFGGGWGAGVYSSANWPPFTEDQNSILKWVLKLNPLIQKIKKVIKTV